MKLSSMFYIHDKLWQQHDGGRKVLKDAVVRSSDASDFAELKVGDDRFVTQNLAKKSRFTDAVKSSPDDLKITWHFKGNVYFGKITSKLANGKVTHHYEELK